MGLRFSPPSGSKDWEGGLNVAGKQFPENRVQGPGSLQSAQCSFDPGARVSELASQSVPEFCRPWGSWRRPGWGSGHLTFFPQLCYYLVTKSFIPLNLHFLIY